MRCWTIPARPRMARPAKPPAPGPWPASPLSPSGGISPCPLREACAAAVASVMEMRSLGREPQAARLRPGREAGRLGVGARQEVDEQLDGVVRALDLRHVPAAVHDDLLGRGQPFG